MQWIFRLHEDDFLHRKGVVILASRDFAIYWRQLRGSCSYTELGCLRFIDLELSIQRDCPADLRRQIVWDAANIQMRRGGVYQRTDPAHVPDNFSVPAGGHLGPPDARRAIEAKRFLTITTAGGAKPK